MSKNINKPFTFKSGLILPNMVLPGPMEGVMSPLFCRTVEEMDLIDLWITPFLRITTGPTRKAKIRSFTEQFSSGSKPVIIQLMGTDIGYLIETAKRCRDMGFSGVNFNLACPSKQVLSSGSGGALVKNHEFIRNLMKASTELGNRFSVSLKIRIGFETPKEIAKIAGSINYGHPDFVVVHYRTACEGYNMVPGREQRLSRAVKYFGDTPVIVNGDIDSYKDAAKVIKETDCAGIMVARNWLKNPNLIRNILSEINTTKKETDEFLAVFLHKMTVNSQRNPGKKDWNSFIEMASYVFERNHPFFEYIINTPKTEPLKELSIDKILSLIC